MMLHIKYQGSMPRGFRQEIVFFSNFSSSLCDLDMQRTGII